MNASKILKRFISLGEQILNFSNTAAQCDFIVHTIQEEIQGSVDIWLMEPYYPLPGDPPVKTFPKTEVPEIVKEVIAFHQPQKKYSSEAGLQAAYPIKTQDILLGVVIIIRKDSGKFSAQQETFIEGFLSHIAVSLQISRQVILKNWRADQLELVQSVSEQILNIFDLDELCQQVAHLIQRSFNYYHVGIYTLDQKTDTLWLRGAANLCEPGDFRLVERIQIGEGMIGLAALQSDEILSPDTSVDHRFRFMDSLPDTKSEFTIPLKVENKVLGVLDIQSDQPDKFHEIDMLVLRSLANNIALALNNANLLYEAKQKTDQISAVVEFNLALTSILDVDILVQKAANLIQERFGYPFVHFFTIHPVRRKIIYAAGSGLRSQAMQENLISYNLDEPVGIIPWVARNNKTFQSNDVTNEDLYVESPLPPAGTRSELSVPISHAGEVLAVLDIQSDKVAAFDENDRSIIEALAATISIAYRNAVLYRSEKWRVQVADSFRQVAEMMSANTSLDELLNVILEKLELNLPCDACAIWLLKEPFQAGQTGQNQLTLAAVRGVAYEELFDILDKQPSILSYLENALISKKPIIRTPTDHYSPLALALQFPEDHSSIAVPMHAGDQPLGIIVLSHHTPSRYGSEAFDITSTYANYAALAIQNARLFSDAQEQAWLSTVLLQVSEATQSLTTVDELLETMVRLPPLLIGIKLSAFLLWEDKFQMYNLKTWYGIEEPSQRFFDEKDSPILGELKAAGSPLFVDNLHEQLGLVPSFIDASDTIVLIPLTSRGSLLGGFLVGFNSQNKSDLYGTSTNQMLSILQGIAHQTSTALENLRLEEAREEEAYVTAVLLESARAVVSQNNIDEILDTIVHLLPILVGINTCVIYLWDDQAQIFRPVQAFTGDEDTTVEDILKKSFLPGEFELLDSVLEDDRLFFSVSLDDKLPFLFWASQPCYSEEELQIFNAQNGINFLLGFPLSSKGKCLGVMLVKDSTSGITLQSRRLEIIQGISQQLALALQNDLYQKEMVESERIEKEFQLARESQLTFLPNHMPKIRGWELDAHWQPARHVGGDFYDIIQLDQNRLALVVADVSDKGMSAALYMTVTRTLIRAFASNSPSPSSILEMVNNALLPDTINGMFVTAVLAICSIKTGRFVYSNAGHNLPLIMRAKTGEIQKLPKGGMALGVLENITLDDHYFAMEPEDTLLLYTDGVTEALSSQNHIFGEERLISLLSSLKKKNAHSIIHAIEKSLSSFREGAFPSDDVTMLCIRRTSAPLPGRKLPEKTLTPRKTEVV